MEMFLLNVKVNDKKKSWKDPFFYKSAPKFQGFLFGPWPIRPPRFLEIQF